MKKELKDYLHLYLGCKVEYGYDGTKKIGTLLGRDDLTGWQVFTSKVLAPYTYVRDELIKPTLRPLSDLKHDDYLELYEILNKEEDNAYGNQSEQYKRNYAALNLTGPEYKPTVFQWLLSKHFDLFGLIDAGIAIDKTNIL